MRRQEGSRSALRRTLKSTANGGAAGTSNDRIPDAVAGPTLLVLCLALALVTAACDGTLDAGRNVHPGLLPVDKHNPVIIANDDWTDNWAGELALLLANRGDLTLVAIVVNASNYWPDVDANLAGCSSLLSAAHASGLKHVPDITPGATAPLTVPVDQKIESTVPLGSAGAQLILSLSRKLYLPGQPLLVVTGAQLTDLADAYLMDPTVVDRVVVLASLGSSSSGKYLMTGPNGDLDPWADWIVAHRFHYIQVSVLYDQLADVTADDIASLPANAFGDWMAAKQPNVSKLTNAADHMAVLAAGVPAFVTAVQPSAPDPAAVFGSPQGQGPPLIPSTTGEVSVVVVTQVADSLVRTQLWQMLQDPRTFGGS